MRALDTDAIARLTAIATVTVILAGLLLTGPLIGVVPLGGSAAEQLGDGNATVADVAIATEVFAISEGRFGTEMWYLRVPDATVDVAATDGRSRLVYRLQVPALNVETVSTAPIASGATGPRHLSIDDPAFAPRTIGRDSYQARVTIRVQSFAVDRTVLDETVAVEVRR